MSVEIFGFRLLCSGALVPSPSSHPADCRAAEVMPNISVSRQSEQRCPVLTLQAHAHFRCHPPSLRCRKPQRDLAGAAPVSAD